MIKHLRKTILEIERRAQVVILSTDITGKGHIRLAFDGGHVVIGNTPSCHRTIANTVAQIRRNLRTPPHAA